jgi:NAD(P)-dependent dehydrogenase (short-subunit alcohol dehydrogenase family)
MAASLIEPIRTAGGGAICLFCSHHGAAPIDRSAMAYGASKAALDNAITRLAHEAAVENTPEVSVRVSASAPAGFSRRRNLRHSPALSKKHHAPSSFPWRCVRTIWSRQSFR